MGYRFVSGLMQHLHISPAWKRSKNLSYRHHDETQEPQRCHRYPAWLSWLSDTIPSEKEASGVQGECPCPQRVSHHGFNENRFHQIDCKKNQHSFDNQDSNTNTESHSSPFPYAAIEGNHRAAGKAGDTYQEIHSVSIGKPIDERAKEIRQKGFYLIVIGIGVGSLIAPFNLYLGGFVACSLISGGLGMRLASYDFSL